MGEYENSQRIVAQAAFMTLCDPALQDLTAMRLWAEGFDSLKDKPVGAGALNYSLAMMSLVACESLGFLVSGGMKNRPRPATKDRRRRRDRWPDVGTYITQVITTYFPPGSSFRHIDKLLADFLRHGLVHGFGSRTYDTNFVIRVMVAPRDAFDATMPVSRIGPFLDINAVALADDTIQAFTAVQQKLVHSDVLCSKVAATKMIRIRPGKKLDRQLDAFRLRCERDRAAKKRVR